MTQDWEQQAHMTGGVSALAHNKRVASSYRNHKEHRLAEQKVVGHIRGESAKVKFRSELESRKSRIEWITLQRQLRDLVTRLKSSHETHQYHLHWLVQFVVDCMLTRNSTL